MRLFKVFPDKVRNILTVLSGSVFAQVLPAFMGLVFSRWFTPGQFGQFVLFQNVFNVSSSVASGKYELGIVGAETEEEGTRIVNAGLFFGGVCGILIFLVGFFLKLTSVKLVFDMWLMLSFSIVSFAVFTPANYWLVRKKEFKKISWNKIVQTSSIVFFTCVLYWADSEQALIYGYVFGWISLMLFSFYQLMKTGYNLGQFKWDTVLEDILVYKEYPIFNVIPGFLTNMAPLLVIYYLTSYFGESTAGYVGHIKQYVFAPMSLIGFSISQVYVQNLAELSLQKKRITPVVAKLGALLLGVTIPMILILNLFGEELFTLIFGEVWKTSGVYSGILSWSYGLIFVVSPLSVVLIALRKVREMAIFPLVYFGLMASLFFFKDLETKEFLVTQTILELLAYITYLLLIIWICFNHDKRLKIGAN